MVIFLYTQNFKTHFKKLFLILHNGHLLIYFVFIILELEADRLSNVQQAMDWLICATEQGHKEARSMLER